MIRVQSEDFDPGVEIAKLHAGTYDHLLDSYFGNSAKVVSINALGQPKPQGSAWNLYGSIPVRVGGIEVILGKSHQPIGIDMSIGSSGVYLLTFYSGNTVRGTDKIQPNPLPNGALASAQVEVPEDAIEKGCDRISIKSLNRDPKSSIGHLFLIE